MTNTTAAAASSSLASATPVNFKMNISVKKFLGASLALGLVVLNLGAQSAAQFGKLPLWFEAGSNANFTAHASDSQFTITRAGAEFTLIKNSGETAGCQLQFVGANPAASISGEQKLAGTINYFLGSNPNQWRASVPTFAQVRVENIYPGVNVVYYGNRQKLEYDFNLSAGINPSVIALHFAGAEKISVDAQGELVIHFSSGEVVQHPPVAYQTVHGARQEIAAGYKILDAHTAAFALGQYDQSEPLVIDPVLSYSSFFGGNYGETAWAIAVNRTDASIYVAGQTFSIKNSNTIPALTFSTPGAFQTNYAGGKLTGDAFVARFNVDDTGTNLSLHYATYLGGTGDDGALGLAVDSVTGNAYVAGYTDSTNFPTTNSITKTSGLYPHISGVLNQYTHTYPVDAFVTELNADGNALVYSTYLGGESMDAAYGIALDDAGDAFVTGYTYSTNFPTTKSTAYQPNLVCSNTVYINANAFVTELAPDGTHLNYSTYLGGTNFDVGRAIAYNNGRLFVAGYTFSTNFPVLHALPGMELDYSNYYTKKIHSGTTNIPVLWTNLFTGKLLNSSTNIYSTASDAFVTAFDTTSTTNWALLYSTYLGGTNNDQATSIAADNVGSAYVAGFTSSTNFPDTVPNLTTSYMLTNGLSYVNATNAFLTKIVWDGTNTSIAASASGYSAMFGGRGLDVANGVALDAIGNAYVIGSATSTNFPVTTNNIGGDLSATNDFLKRNYRSDVFVIAFNPNASALLFSTYIGGVDNDFGNAIAVDPMGVNAYIAGQTLSTNFPAVNALQARRNGTNDMFIGIIALTNTPAPTLVLTPTIASQSVQGKIAGAAPATASGLNLKWQMFPANYDVESSADLTPSGWHPVSAVPAYSNGWYYVTLPTTNGVQFFRLHKH
jgi:hypothetical protein